MKTVFKIGSWNNPSFHDQIGYGSKLVCEWAYKIGGIWNCIINSVGLITFTHTHVLIFKKNFVLWTDFHLAISRHFVFLWFMGPKSQSKWQKYVQSSRAIHPFPPRARSRSEVWGIPGIPFEKSMAYQCLSSFFPNRYGWYGVFVGFRMIFGLIIWFSCQCAIPSNGLDVSSWSTGHFSVPPVVNSS